MQKRSPVYWTRFKLKIMTSNLKRKTASGDYPVPSRFHCGAANLLLRTARWVPPALRARFIRQRTYSYQTFNQGDPGNTEGLSIKKWEAMRMPPNLTGKSVLDIGCAEGFFCRLSAISGAAPVVGIDTSLGRLLSASFMALQERRRISLSNERISRSYGDRQIRLRLLPFRDAPFPLEPRSLEDPDPG